MVNETYINASHIVGLSEMDKSSKNFIACQSPTDSARFWKMVMQEKVEQIIMLCPLEGPRGVESGQYWL